MKLEVYALYRCINSPIEMKITFAGGAKHIIGALDARGSSLVLHTRGGGDLSCRIEALSAEEQRALDQKRADERRASEEATRKREAEKQAVINSIQPEEMAKMEAALAQALEKNGYELMGREIARAYAGSNIKDLSLFVRARNKNTNQEHEGEARAVFRNEKFEKVTLY